MSVFDKVSGEYRNAALVQRSAAVKLAELLRIGGSDSVLDVACGPGHITDAIRKMTDGCVAGIDISAGMIEKAAAAYPGIEFRVGAAEELDIEGEFDVVFCNSSFQWFREPAKALGGMFRALKSGGRVGISCPATKKWSPFFDSVIAEAASDPSVEDTIKRWRSPWFTLDGSADYEALFRSAGFGVSSLEIADESKEYGTEEAYRIYLSGAANGFASQEFYDCPIDGAFVDRFNGLVKKAMQRQSAGGKNTVSFRRLYFVGSK